MSAWGSLYEKGLSAPAGSNLGYAIIAIKHELAYQGFGHGMILDTPVFGDAARNRAIDFQHANSLTGDGVIGPHTAQLLFEKRARAVDTSFGIPDDLVCKIKSQESANDPAAIGYSDPDDHGLMQINLRLHPAITLAQAVDPSVALPWAAKQLLSNQHVLGDWEATLASYNVGLGGAEAWLAAGKPATGGTASDPTLYARATEYVALVHVAPC